jgi:DNA modification methylase
VTNPPGVVRDAIVEHLEMVGAPQTAGDIARAVADRIGGVPSSSVRSYLAINTPRLFERVERGKYRIAASGDEGDAVDAPSECIGGARIVHIDTFDWIAGQPPDSIHAVVTDPPFGVVEYSAAEQTKLRAGRGGVWRIPPSFDGHQRSPLPRFTTLGPDDRRNLHAFFLRLSKGLRRVLVPGANVAVASNSLLSHLVAAALEDAGLEVRGAVYRLVMTMRGGDRPKNAHHEFQGVSVMPRSMAEPWVIARKPLDGRVQDNLRRWGTGGWRRPGPDRPFGDVITSRPTSKRERAIAPHPSLKPQAFMRAIVRASLPLGEGTVFDPFAGAGSTLAAANAVGYASVGTEIDHEYYDMARQAIDPLGALSVQEDPALT